MWMLKCAHNCSNLNIKHSQKACKYQTKQDSAFVVLMIWKTFRHYFYCKFYIFE